jgi:hypothetical protein
MAGDADGLVPLHTVQEHIFVLSLSTGYPYRSFPKLLLSGAALPAGGTLGVVVGVAVVAAAALVIAIIAMRLRSRANRVLPIQADAVIPSHGSPPHSFTTASSRQVLSGDSAPP